VVLSAQQREESPGNAVANTVKPREAVLVARVQQRQLQRRARTVDERMKVELSGCEVAPSSDHRLREYYLQKHNQDVLLYMRGDKNKTGFFGKDGAIAPARPSHNCTCRPALRADYCEERPASAGQVASSYWRRHEARLHIATAANHRHCGGRSGRPRAASSRVHCLCRDRRNHHDGAVLEWNLPCSRADCKHEQELRVFDDYSGW
jgi:hypothetical protein